MISKSVLRCDSIARLFLGLTGILTLFAFIPGGFLPEGTFKGYLLITGVSISLISWLLGRLFEGSVRIPRTRIITSFGVLLFVLLLSALFSQTPLISFLGEGFGTGTFMVLASLIVSAFLMGTLFKQAHVVRFLSYISITYIVVALYQVIHIVFPRVTTLGTFFSQTATPVGLLSDVAIFSGLMLVGVVLFFEFLKPSRFMKVTLTLVAAFALFFMLLVNISIVWLLTGGAMLFILVYKLVITRESETRRFPYLALSGSLLCILFIFANKLLGGIVPSIVGINFANIVPSADATFAVAKQSLQAQPFFGAGLNRFATEWIIHRPLLVNVHTFWNVPFSTGFGYLPTVGITGGFITILGLILFIFATIVESVKYTFKTQEVHVSAFSFSVFLLTLYALFVLVFYAPSISIIALAFFLLGLFLATLQGKVPVRTISFLKDQRVSFFGILSLVVLIIASVGGLYATTERFVSIVYLNKAVVAGDAYGDFNRADRRLATAAQFSDSPSIERSRVRLARTVLNQLIAQSEDEKVSQETLRAQLQQVISSGDAAGRRAVALDTKDVQNYLTLGNFMSFVATLKVEGSADAAESAFKRAIEVAPNYPEPYLGLASLYFGQERTEDALTYVDMALEKKPNYTEAYYLMAQAEVEAGNTKAAIEKIEEATLVDPNNANLYLTLGLLRFDARDYKAATSAFRASVNLNPRSANSWYFLALAQNWGGDNKEAIEILTLLNEQLPESENIQEALEYAEKGQRIPRQGANTELPVEEGEIEEEN